MHKINKNLNQYSKSKVTYKNSRVNKYNFFTKKYSQSKLIYLLKYVFVQMYIIFTL